jgi:hypothetical protein
MCTVRWEKKSLARADPRSLPWLQRQREDLETLDDLLGPFHPTVDALFFWALSLGGYLTSVKSNVSDGPGGISEESWACFGGLGGLCAEGFCAW